ncbi:MAG TPA: response regulator [Candidatus Latescibacteria bacterium]|nr:response regulator [Candidatus Latescibacterota bacterium]
MAEKKILIVDYDAASLEKLSKLLKSHKFPVIQASDGQAGYDLFVAEKPDLVVLEAMLPKMHGFDLTKRISQESQGRIPVVLITGLYKGPHYKQEALGPLGAAEFFEKPLDLEAFVGAIKRLLHDEDDLDEPLPDSNAVIEALSRRGRGQPSPSGEGKSAHKGKRP